MAIFTDEEIVDTNRMLAEFDGWVFTKDVEEFPLGCWVKEEDNMLLFIRHIDDFAYHWSWDALMNIVYRIVDIGGKLPKELNWKIKDADFYCLHDACSQWVYEYNGYSHSKKKVFLN